MITVFGAGAIGCWVGGKLAAGGADVTLIGRPRLMEELRERLVISETGQAARSVRVRTATEAGAAAGSRLVLVTVKSAQTEEAARALAPHIAEDAVVVSLQNGVQNPEVIARWLPTREVLAGMVPFNVVRSGPGAYHRGSSGALRVQDHPGARTLLDACARAALPVEARSDMAAVQWGKLLLNLNNAINALCGLPLRSELAQKPFRRCLAAAQREALALLTAARIRPARLTPVPPSWQPALLGLPDPLFRLILPRVVAVDAQARSSMWDDLEAGRPTEIDYLQGELVRLAERLGTWAPVNERLLGLVRAAEAGGRRDYTGDELEQALGLA